MLTRQRDNNNKSNPLPRPAPLPPPQPATTTTAPSSSPPPPTTTPPPSSSSTAPFWPTTRKRSLLKKLQSADLLGSRCGCCPLVRSLLRLWTLRPQLTSSSLSRPLPHTQRYHCQPASAAALPPRAAATPIFLAHPPPLPTPDEGSHTYYVPTRLVAYSHLS